MANTKNPKDAFADLNRCIQQQNIAQCRSLVTADSTDLYDRFVSYGVIECLPKDATYISQKPAENEIYITVSVTSAGEKRYMGLMFAYEDAQWKLDVPNSLHNGLGDNWENQVNAIEKIYLIMHQTMGAKLNCMAIQNLGNIKH